MSSVQSLRDFISQRLTAAAAEIFTAFEKTIVQYEEEIDRQRRLLDITWRPQIKPHRIDLPHHYLCKEEDSTDQQLCHQERSSSLNQEEPRPPQIKEEQEELCTSQVGELLVVKQEADTFMVTPAFVESGHVQREPKSHQIITQNLLDRPDQDGSNRQDSGATRHAELYRRNNVDNSSRFMSSVGDEIKLVILKALPNLSEDTQKQIIAALEISGVESTEDLKYVQQDDLRDLLPVSQQRKILEAFKMESTTVTLGLQILPDDSTHTSGTSVSSPLPCSSSSLSNTSSLTSSSRPSAPCSWHSLRQSASMSSKWHETFEVPWDKMPEEVQSAIANSKRPAPDKRRQMIRILVDEMKRYEVNPKRSECLVICQNLVKQYPSSFADMTPGGVIIAGGFTSLLSQVKTRIENVNRAGMLKRHRTSRRFGRLQRPTDSYGCTQFQPEPPAEETSKTVEKKRQQLVNVYRQEGIQGSERAEVMNLMKTTFCLQRNHINQTPAPSIEDLRIQWPYLFTPKGLYCHFELLTDINVLHFLELSIEECGQGIEKYLRTKLKNKDVQCEAGELTLCIIQLLMTYFDERTEGLILFADMSATAADVERAFTLPTSPRLILLVAGDGVALDRWMISIEGQVICEGTQKSFITGLAAVFATYYVFNLQYQEEAARTLEFVQRRLIGINPERGRKTSQGKVVSKKTGKLVHKKATTVNPHVATLLKNLMDFEWGFI